MPKYLSFFAYTADAAKAMIDSPSDRAAAVRAGAKAVGAKLEAYYWMFGRFDGFVIYDAPDSQTAAAFALAVASTGTVSALETHEVFTAAQVIPTLEKAKKARTGYKPPVKK